MRLTARRLDQCLEVGVDEIVQRDGVDDVLIGGSVVVHLKDELCALAISYTVVTEGPEVIVLAWVVGIVPIADVDDAKVFGALGTRPVHELRERPDSRLGSE